MAYWRGEEALMCRMFPASLGDTALRWFDKLPPAKIDSFRELAEQFAARFITNSRMIKGPEALTQLRKKSGETLREYSQRYFELYQETEDCDPRFALSTFKFGLPYDGNGIYNDLTRRPPKTFNDLLARVDEFSRVEDDDKAMSKQQGFKRDRNVNDDRKDDNHDKKNRRETDRKDNADEDRKSNAFKGVNTVFNKPISKILQEIKDERFFKWPRPMLGDPKMRNSSLKCFYHKDHGHATDTCRTLKQFLEELVEQGRLTKYTKRDETKPNEQPRMDKANRDSTQVAKPAVGTIEAIHGIVNSTEATRNYLRARLARARLWAEAHPVKEIMSVSAPPKRDRENNVVYQLSFSEEDLEGIDVPHNDALVIMANICNFDVKRVLIDPGSSSEVMYLKAYNELKPFISNKSVRQVDSPIYSFSGDAVWPICIVSVPVRIGEVVVVTDFFVMNVESPYNALLGRNWLGEMRAVASPFHQKLKFPTPKGVCVVRGKQEDARYCFNLAIRGSQSEMREAVQLEGPKSVCTVERENRESGKESDMPEPSCQGKGKEHCQ
ncbi:hypothetical protein LguiB_001336 [Lonicera macranthoides]